jgi:DNA-binding NarL/FixJ family response regulator
MITIIVVDDHPLFRQGVVDSLSLEPDFNVVAQAADGKDAVRLILELKPTVAIVDVNLPGLNGQQVVRSVIAQKLQTRVILLTAYDDLEQITHAMRGGASAYCTKDIEPEKLIQLIRQVASGKYVLDGQVLDAVTVEKWLTNQMDKALRSYGDPGEPFYPLSDREMEVLGYLTQGLSNKEIANRLKISHQTVKNHVTSILRKLGVEDRTQAAVFALRQGWVRLDQQYTTTDSQEK